MIESGGRSSTVDVTDLFAIEDLLLVRARSNADQGRPKYPKRADRE